MSASRPPASPAVKAALMGHDPTDEQWAAISHPLVPIHLIAGAGSGKTAVMAARIVWAIEDQGYLPSQILGLTFTNKAAEELQERVRLALEVEGKHRPEDVTVQTYNAFASGIVREHGLLVRVEPEAGLLSDAQQWQLVLSCVDLLPPFDAIQLRTPASIVRSTLALAGSLADHMVSTGDVRAADEHLIGARDVSNDIRETVAKRRELCFAVDAYLEAKHRHQRIDFGDQVTKAVRILQDFPQVQKSYAERYPLVLLDEYQDTNVTQRLLMQALVKGSGAVTAVGDARQAIYAFRGATMYNLIGFAKHFPRADGASYEPISLSENFRSGANILEAANSVVAGIDPERRPGLPLRARSTNGAGEVALGLFGDEHSEAVFIADEIDRLHGSPAAPGRDPLTFRDFAILARRKSTMDAIREVLEERDIPVEVVGLGGLLKTPEVIEVLAWLRALEARPSANRWVGRLLLGPRWRIHYRDLALCARWATEQNSELRLRLAGGDEERARDLAPGDVAFSLAEALDRVGEIDDLGDEAKHRLNDFSERLRRLRTKTHAPLLELVQEIIRQTGISDALESSPHRTASAAKQNLSNFLDHVAAFAPVEGEATLRNFLAYLDAADAADETLDSMQPAEHDSVKLMTVHSAKGLEFECVFVPAVASPKNAKGEYVYSVFPDNRASNPLTSYGELPYDVREDRSHLPRLTGTVNDFKAAVKERALEDERRLFYVALTRAKQRLYVTAAWWYGRKDRPTGPSLFWEELRALAGTRGIQVVSEVEQPEVNPMIDVLEGRRSWPPVPRAGVDDSLFEQGWGAAAEAIVDGRLEMDTLLVPLGAGERQLYDDLVGERERELNLIEAARAVIPQAEPQVPSTLSATSLVRLEAGEMSAWDLVRPLPDRPTYARRLGTEIHRLIEERSRGIAPFADENELDEPGEVTGPGVMSRLLTSWEASGYAERTPATLPSGESMIEFPFALRSGDKVIRGRIDAVYETDDGGLEIVDVKTGARREVDDLDQLGIYAEALAANGLIQDDQRVLLSYVYLDGDPPATREWKPRPGGKIGV
jgi:DNA helicase-2/ATP-dependent DNA helicase PcrA